MIAALVGAASALDAHGTAAPPTVGEGPAAPLLVWEPGAPSPGAALTLQGALQPALAWPEDGDAPRALLDELVGLEVGGGYRLGRFGVTLSLPLWAHYRGVDGEVTGAIPGDLRLTFPVTLWSADRLRVGLRAEGVAPTGDAEVLLGGGWGGGLHVNAGSSGPGLSWGAGAGLTADSEATYANVDRTVSLPVSAYAGYGNDTFGGGLEAWLSPSLSATDAPLSSSPGELLARVGVRTAGGLSITLGGGYAISPGIGSAGGRALLRVGWSAPAAPRTPRVPVPEPVAVAVTTDVVVHVSDTTGAPVVATVTVQADGGAALPKPVRTGADGTATVALTAGAWRVAIAGEGLGAQAREVVVADDAWRPATFAAMLAPAEGGTADLTLRVVDAAGNPVEGADVTVDGVGRGATSTGGTLTLLDLTAGSRTVSVRADGYTRSDPTLVPLDAADRTQIVVLRAAPGAVRVIARSEGRAAAGAQVRFLGTGAATPPEALGDDGEAIVELKPGPWTAILTAPSLGFQERAVLVQAGATALLLVDVEMARVAGEASLGVRVMGPTGELVRGAEISIDGAAVGRTSGEGSLRVAGLSPGKHTLSARGTLLRPTEPRALEVAGARDVDLLMEWAPGTVSVRVRGPEGEPVDATVAFVGPGTHPSEALGIDGQGQYTLAAGDWRVVVSAPSFGLQERQVSVEPDGVTRVDIDAALLRDAGPAVLALQVRGPSNAPVAGAFVRVDDRDVGTLGGSGGLRIAGLTPGKHRITIDGMAKALGGWSEDLTLVAGENRVDAAIAWAARAVRVTARAGDAPVSDAIARAFGPSARPAVPLGRDGVEVIAIDAQQGWEIVASSEAFGVRSAAVQPNPANPTELELRFEPPVPGRARLALEVRSPSGAPVQDAHLRIGAQNVDMTFGTAIVSDLPLGITMIKVESPGFTSIEEKLVLVEGSQDRRLRLTWLPRTLQIDVRDPRGAPIDAQVRLVGADTLAAGDTGPDGRVDVNVLPGDWQVVASAPANGARSVAARVPPGAGPVPVTLVLDAALVEVTQDIVRLDASIAFGFNAATLDPTSVNVLEQVAAALSLHPELVRVEIQGHTDDKGDAVYNLDLSQRRADEVRAWLVGAGVAPERLVAKGYGAAVPLGTNGTEAGRRSNRRVQLLILERK